MKLDPDRAAWPKLPEEIVNEGKAPRYPSYSATLKSADYKKDCFVHEGKLILRPLGRKGVARPIPPGECAITSLAVAPDGRVYGATSGTRAHLFVFDTSPEIDAVVDLGVLGEHCAVTNSLVITRKGGVVIGTRNPDDDKTDGRFFLFDSNSYDSYMHGFGAGRIEDLGQPVKGEGIAVLAIDRNSERIYGLTSSTGTLFELDADSGKLTMLGKVDDACLFSEAIVISKDGAVYGGRKYGELFRYVPGNGRIDGTGIRIPAISGRAMYNRIDSVTLDGASGHIYGGGSADGVFFRFEPDTQRMVTLGKPVVQPGIKCLTAGNDGRIYGIGGDKGGCAHLFLHDADSGELRDLGVPLAASEKYWHGYEFSSAATGKWGEIYLGESDRISHLFIYYPPIRPQRPPGASCDRQ